MVLAPGLDGIRGRRNTHRLRRVILRHPRKHEESYTGWRGGTKTGDVRKDNRAGAKAQRGA